MTPRSALDRRLRIELTVLVDGGHGRDLAVETIASTPVGEVADAIATFVGPPTSAAHPLPAQLFLGRTALARDIPIGASPIAEGCRLGLGIPVETGPRRTPVSPENGFVAFHRVRRKPPRPEPFRLRMPDPPDLEGFATGSGGFLRPWVFVAAFTVPLSLAALLGRGWAFVIAAAGPALVLRSELQDRRSRRRARQFAQSHYDEEVRRVEAAFEEALRREQQNRRELFPGPAEARSIALGHRPRLWERRREDDDYLDLRVGTGTHSWPETIAGPETPRGELQDVPTVLPLRSIGALGITLPFALGRALARWMVAQCALLHSSSELQLCVVAPGPQSGDWAWARWLPHLRATGERDATLLIGNNLESAHLRIAELNELITQRARRSPPSPVTGRREREVVVVFDDAVDADVRGIGRILSEGPGVGIYSICLARAEHGLPPGCEANVVPNDGEPAVFVAPGKRLPATRLDLVDVDWCDEVARAVAPIRDVDGVYEAANLPSSVPLRDLPGVPTVSASAVARLWEENPRSTTAVIGETADGPFAIDLVDDGPHVLVGGATGSGKSELLRTIVASLSLVNRPDEMAFLLVDYKGGASWSGLDGLPHVAGEIVDLDPHLGERTLVALNAELNRRAHVLAEVGAPTFDRYRELRRNRPDLGTFPRLVIVVDEVASILYDAPDLFEGLLSAAARGRALGVHLFLSTQRSAVLPETVRAQTNLRIALRVLDAAESISIIGGPEAGALDRQSPGRAYARSGSGPLVLFQSASVGLDAPEPEEAAAVMITALSWERAGKRHEPVHTIWNPEQPGADAIVRATSEAALALGIPRPRQPIPPPLPALVQVSELPDAPGGAVPPPLPYGMSDSPAQQRLEPAALDLSTTSHLLVVGERGTGRTQLLRAVGAAVVQRTSPQDVHLYAVASGDAALAPLAAAPHCGAVVTDTEPDRIDRLLKQLTASMRRREELLARQGMVDVSEQRRAAPEGHRLPHVVVLLDNWDRFVRAFGHVLGGRLVEDVFALVRDGKGAGIHLVVTAPLEAAESVLAGMVDETLVLGFRGPRQMRGALRDRASLTVTPGRGFSATSGLELQVGLLDGEPTTAGQAESLARLARAARDAAPKLDASRGPFRVDELSLVEDRFHVGDTQGRPVGREDVLAWLRDRHATRASTALLGQRRAGKTWILTELQRRLVEQGSTAVHRVTIPTPSSAVHTPDELAAELLPRVARGASPADALLHEAADRAPTSDPLVLLLDEAGRLLKYHPSAVSWLRDVGQTGAWMVYTGTQKDWNVVVRWALSAPGSSFGNDVNVRVLGPLRDLDAATFLAGTASNLGVSLGQDVVDSVIELVGAWPFYLQVVGDALVRAVHAGDVAVVEDRAALAALVEEHLLNEWSRHFDGRWAEIGRAGRGALLRNPRADVPDLAPGQASDLRDVGLVTAGGAWLSDRPFFAWVARNSVRLGSEEVG